MADLLIAKTNNASAVNASGSTTYTVTVTNNGPSPADGAIVKDPVQDQVVWTEYLETVVKERADWKDLYRAFREQV